MPGDSRPSLDQLLGPRGGGGQARPSLDELLGTTPPTPEKPGMLSRVGDILYKEITEGHAPNAIENEGSLPLLLGVMGGGAPSVINGVAHYGGQIANAIGTGAGLVKKASIPLAVGYGLYKGARGLLGH